MTYKLQLHSIMSTIWYLIKEDMADIFSTFCINGNIYVNIPSNILIKKYSSYNGTYKRYIMLNSYVVVLLVDVIIFVS